MGKIIIPYGTEDSPQLAAESFNAILNFLPAGSESEKPLQNGLIFVYNETADGMSDGRSYHTV
jgi:hypothetical protein